MKQQKTSLQLYRRLLSYLKPYTGLLSLSIVMTLLYALSNVFIIPLVRDITEELKDQNLMNFSNHVINAVLLYGIRLGSKYGQTYVMEKISYKMTIRMRMQLYKKLQSFSMRFYSKWKLGDVVSRVLSDVEQVKLAVMLNFESVLPNILTLFGVIAYLFFINWKLALVSVILVPAFIYVISYFSERMKRVSGQIQRKTADITHVLWETLANIKVVQAFTMEEHEIDKFHSQNQKNYTASMMETKVRTTQEPILGVLQFLVFMVVVWYGGYLVVEGQMTGPVLVSFFTGILTMVDPVIVLSKVYATTFKSMASAERIFELLDEQSDIVSPTNPKTIAKVEGHLQLDSVSFSYDPEAGKALKNISLDVQPGEMIALVGLSGSGKSTLVSLLPRFYDPNSGTVRLDGVDVRELELQFLREQIAIVPQDNFLFRGTILENVRYGELNASEEDVIQALKKANAWEFVQKMPDGVLAKIGDQGRRLSGGQKQRLAIARAILRNPKILILDEATSALDSESEKLVQEALNELMKDRTTFVIAHRLSTIQHAHKIVVMENGEIVEQGRHETLLAQAGAYNRFYSLQFNKKETGA